MCPKLSPTTLHYRIEYSTWYHSGGAFYNYIFYPNMVPSLNTIIILKHILSIMCYMVGNGADIKGVIFSFFSFLVQENTAE